MGDGRERQSLVRKRSDKSGGEKRKGSKEQLGERLKMIASAISFTIFRQSNINEFALYL